MYRKTVDENYAQFKDKYKFFGAKLSPRGVNDNHILVELLSEDDGHWWIENSFSTYFLDSYIEMLLKVKKELERNPKYKIDKEGGYKF